MGRLRIRALAPGDRDAALAVINTAARWYRDFLPPEAVHDPEMKRPGLTERAKRKILAENAMRRCPRLRA